MKPLMLSEGDVRELKVCERDFDANTMHSVRVFLETIVDAAERLPKPPARSPYARIAQGAR